MALEVGTKLGTYVIQAAIGAGGMGEVYRAQDTKLGREVAIKVLHEALRRDAERLARFEREARVLASLNHPGIATLYGLEAEGSITYLVMELVHGETLQERLARGRLTIEEAADIFEQIAEALEAAHAAGVVHRDLKPANIKITPEGRVKILDFGLAKAFALDDDEPVTDLSSSPTRTRGATAVGVIMGTASYMSPEQARGKKADKRADIWAFGCVLFEAISGNKAFDGESVTDVLANVIHKDVPWAVLPAETPWRVGYVLRRCLAKDPGQRFHDMADARIELLGDERPPGLDTETPASKSRLVILTGGLFGLVIALSVALATFALREEESPPGDLQAFVITPPTSEPPLLLETPMISPDGRRIVYIGVREDDRRLYLRELGELGSRILAGTEGAHSPFFSPDGLWVGFFAGGKIKKVSIPGGAPIDICDVYAEGPGGSWTANDTIWFSGNWISGFFEVLADGGEPVPVTTPDRERGEIGHWWPDFLPVGKSALFTVFTDEGSHRIAALDLDTGTWKHLFPGMQARYVPSGHIVYYASGIYQVVAFDPSRIEYRGSAVPVLDGTRGIGPADSVDRYFDVSDTGIVVSVPGGAIFPRSVLTWLELDGGVETVPFDSAAIGSLRLDRIGTRVALTRIDGGIQNIWIYDLERGTEEKITLESTNFDPQWTPDGRRIVFTTARRGAFDILVKPTDVLATEEPLVTRDDVDESSEALSPDGRWLAIAEFAIGTGADIAILDLRDGSEPVPAAKTPFQEDSPYFSRDSEWLAYRSYASGGPEIYVQRVADRAGRVRVSSNGGSTPRWSPIDDELYYVAGDTIMALGYRVVGAEFRAETPRALVKLPEGHSTENKLDVSPDGKRFLLAVETGEDPSPTELHVKTNWFEELKRLTGPN